MDWKDLGITINHLFRYGYGGLLAFLTGAVVFPNETKATVQALGGGGALPALVAFGIGGAVYAFYRAFLNEPFILPFFDWIHRKLESRWGYRETESSRTGCNCKRHYLEDVFGVAHVNSMDAYRLIRDNSVFERERAQRFELQHSEIHLLYLTSTVLAFFFVSSITHQWSYGVWDRIGVTFALAVIALLCFGFALGADICVCRRECHYLMTLDKKKVGEILEQSQLGRTPADPAGRG